MASHSLLEMARPSPEPPYRRVGDASTWLKDLNSSPRSAAEIPMPVSLTLKCSVHGGHEEAAVPTGAIPTGALASAFSCAAARLLPGGPAPQLLPACGWVLPVSVPLPGLLQLQGVCTRPGPAAASALPPCPLQMRASPAPGPATPAAEQHTPTPCVLCDALPPAPPSPEPAAKPAPEPPPEPPHSLPGPSAHTSSSSAPDSVNFTPLCSTFSSTWKTRKFPLTSVKDNMKWTVRAATTQGCLDASSPAAAAARRPTRRGGCRLPRGTRPAVTAVTAGCTHVSQLDADMSQPGADMSQPVCACVTARCGYVTASVPPVTCYVIWQRPGGSHT